MMLPQLYVSDVPLSCINAAAQEFHVPAKLLIAVLNVERGRVGLAKQNKNGTYDLGPMQINSGTWWPRLYKYSITPQEVVYNPCMNMKVAAWILAKSIADNQNLLSGIGDYNSHTVNYNHCYTQRVRFIYSGLTNFSKFNK